jgi:Na+-translocating ferredoxin:NAD+ oxidoreductase RnfD subunit
MNLFNKKISSNHLITAAIIVVLVLVSAYMLGQIPLALLVSIITAVVVDLLLDKYFKKTCKIPISAVITGLIIGSIAPINASFVLVILAVLLAELSKFFIRFKGSNIFNPAAFGLLVSLAVFSVGDSWWAAPSFNFYSLAIPLSFILVIAAYKAKRIVESLSFIAMVLILSFVSNSFQLSAIASALIGLNYYFAFAMVSDPKTSPHKFNQQIAFGAFIALVFFALSVYSVPYALLASLLVGNLSYVAYRVFNSVKSTA